MKRFSIGYHDGEVALIRTIGDPVPLIRGKAKGAQKVKIETRQFGTITIDDDKIITMPKGMPGFPELKRFVLLDHDEIKPFYSFQSVDDTDLAFIIMDPFLFKPDYQVDIEPYTEEMAWGKNNEDELFLYVIINATNPDPKKITANLIGPLLININKNEGIQMMLSDGRYSHKFLVFSENKNGETE